MDLKSNMTGVRKRRETKDTETQAQTGEGHVTTEAEIE